MTWTIDLCTPTDVTDRLNMTGKTSVAQDAMIASFITAASREVERITGTLFGSEGTPSVPVTKTLRADGTEVLRLRPYLYSLSSVTAVIGSGLSAQSLALTQDTDYYLDERTVIPGWVAPPYSQLIFASSYIPEYETKVQVAGCWGFYSASSAPAGVPADVREAVAIHAARAWREKDASLSDISGTDEMGHLLFSKAMQARVKLILDGWAGARL